MQQQIRPKVRKRTQPKVASSEGIEGGNNKDGDKSEGPVEETRQRLENWMGLGRTTTSSSIQSSGPALDNTSTVLDNTEKLAPTTKKTIQLASAFAQNDEESGANQAKIPNAISKDPPKSILRQPKYSQPHKTVLESTTTPPEQPTNAFPPDGTPATQTTPSHVGSASAFPGEIVERDPMTAIAQRQKKKASTLPPPSTSTTIEGYNPQTTTSVAGSSASLSPAVVPSPVASMPSAEDDDDDDNSNDPDPLILSSVEELFQAAGDPQLVVPDAHRVTPDAQLVEADLSFSVLSQDQYQGKLPELRRQHEEEHQAQLQMFLGTDDVFDEEDDEEGGADDEEEEDWMEMLMQGDGEEDENDENAMNQFQDDAEEEEERELRAFRQLWDALSEWTTPEAVAYSQHLQSLNDGGSETSWKTPLIERSDVESSRCAGLMAMIKLYLPKSLQELGFAHDLRRKADTRLGELLRTFNYSQEAPKLPVKLWKAMTCILLEVVMNAGVDSASIVAVPPAAGAVGLSLDEYRYLSRSALATFANSTKSDD